MANTITIKVDALTEEANAKMQAFFQSIGVGVKSVTSGGKAADGTSESLKKLRVSSMLAKEGFHGLQTTVMLLGGAHFPMLAEAITGGRMALMTMRTAAQLTGLTLGTIVPIVGGIGVAVAAGVAIWKLYQDGLKATAEQARKTGEEIKGVGKFLENLNALRSSGGITAAQQGFYLDVLRGAGGSGPTPRDQRFLDEFLKNKKGPGRRAGESYDPEALKKLQDYLMAEGHLTPGAEGEGPSISPANEALLKIRELRKEIARSDLTEEEKKISEISDKYVKLAEAVKVWGAAAIQGGQYNQAALDKVLKSIDLAENAELRQLDFEKAARDEKMGQEAFARRSEELTKQAIEERAELERKLTLIDLQESEKRGKNYEKEFQKRKFLLEQQFYGEGTISEKEFTALMEETTAKRIDGQHKEGEDLRRVAEAEAEINLARIQGRRKLMESDPDLTQAQKKEKLLELLREEKKALEDNIALYEAMVRDTKLSPEAHISAVKKVEDLRQRHAATDQDISTTSSRDTFSGEMRRVTTEMQDQFGSVAHQIAETFRNVVGTAIASVSNSITGLIMGTEKWSDTLKKIEGSVMSQLINSIIKMGLEYVQTHGIMKTATIAFHALGKLLRWGEVADKNAAAAATIPAQTTEAALTSVSSYGAAAAAGAAALIAAMSQMTSSVGSAYAEGGRPEPGMLALVGERGPELFIPDVPGTILPADETTAALHRARSGSGSQALSRGPGKGSEIHVHNWFSEEAMTNHIKNNRDVDHHIIEVVGKHTHVLLANK